MDEIRKNALYERRKKARERQRANRKIQKALDQIGTKDNGYTDLTPYSAITGKEAISRSTPTELKTRVKGSFNG